MVILNENNHFFPTIYIQKFLMIFQEIENEIFEKEFSSRSLKALI